MATTLASAGTGVGALAAAVFLVGPILDGQPTVGEAMRGVILGAGTAIPLAVACLALAFAWSRRAPRPSRSRWAVAVGVACSLSIGLLAIPLAGALFGALWGFAGT